VTITAAIAANILRSADVAIIVHSEEHGRQ
jgi:hypothetical protein